MTREDIKRDPRPDGRPERTDSYGPDNFKIPDCAYKSYDTFTWPEGKADPKDLPCGNRQTDDWEDIEPKR